MDEEREKNQMKNTISRGKRVIRLITFAHVGVVATFFLF